MSDRATERPGRELVADMLGRLVSGMGMESWSDDPDLLQQQTDALASLALRLATSLVAATSRRTEGYAGVLDGLPVELRDKLRTSYTNIRGGGVPYTRGQAHATFNGGHETADTRRAFHHGMDTVFNLVDAGLAVRGEG